MLCFDKNSCKFTIVLKRQVFFFFSKGKKTSLIFGSFKFKLSILERYKYKFICK